MSESRIARTVRVIPVARLIATGQLLLLVREHVLRLDTEERHRVIELVRKGRGRPSRLTLRERRELQRLVAKAEPRLFARSAARTFAPLGRKRR